MFQPRLILVNLQLNMVIDHDRGYYTVEVLFGSEGGTRCDWSDLTWPVLESRYRCVIAMVTELTALE